MDERPFDLSQDLNSILSRTADLNRWCLRAMERGGVTKDSRSDMMDAAARIEALVAGLTDRP